MLDTFMLVLCSVVLGVNIQTLVFRLKLGHPYDATFWLAVFFATLSFILVGIFAYIVG